MDNTPQYTAETTSAIQKVDAILEALDAAALALAAASRSAADHGKHTHQHGDNLSATQAYDTHVYLSDMLSFVFQAQGTLSTLRHSR